MTLTPTQKLSWKEYKEKYQKIQVTSRKCHKVPKIRKEWQKLQKVQIPEPVIISKYQKEPESTRFFRNYQKEQGQGVTG